MYVCMYVCMYQECFYCQFMVYDVFECIQLQFIAYILHNNSTCTQQFKLKNDEFSCYFFTFKIMTHIAVGIYQECFVVNS